MATVEKIGRGVAGYIEREIMPTMSDANAKVMLGTIVAGLSLNPGMVAAVMDIPFVRLFVPANKTENNCEYDIAIGAEALKRSINANGKLSVIMPGIKLLGIEARKLSFDANDIDTLKRYIEEA